MLVNTDIDYNSHEEYVMPSTILGIKDGRYVIAFTSCLQAQYQGEPDVLSHVLDKNVRDCWFYPEHYDNKINDKDDLSALATYYQYSGVKSPNSVNNESSLNPLPWIDLENRLSLITSLTFILSI